MMLVQINQTFFSDIKNKCFLINRRSPSNDLRLEEGGGGDEGSEILFTHVFFTVYFNFFFLGAFLFFSGGISSK